ncbi:MAG: MobF family relaxase [Actinomycetota bacterium]
MSAGHGYQYLTSSVAIGDGQRQSGLPLTAYYTADGTPPGRWLGTGLTALGNGRLRAGDVVEEAQLALLLGEGRDPISGDPLGRAYPKYKSRAERVAARVARLDPGLDQEQRAAAVAAIESAEASRATRRAVAGYDITFSVPKSVSVLWALAPAEVQAEIVAAHHAAIDDVIGLFEAEVAATRIGVDAGDGAVAQVDVAGVAAVAFDHFDSRAGDPQLHTHVVIANKVRTALDGKWRSLDGRPIHAAMVALSEHYRAVLADHLTTRLGLTWQQRDRGVDRNACWDLAGVPDELLELFSSRAAAIGVAKDDLIAAYVAEHGHQPSPRTVLKLRQQATLATRPDKTVTPLGELMTGWRDRASAVLEHPAEDWAARLLREGQRSQQLLTADALSDPTIAGVARHVVEVVGERRSTWRRWNLHAETSRQLAGVRFATTGERTIALHRIVHAAEQQSVRLTPPELATVPAELRRADGTSVLRPRHSDVFTSADLLAAEDRLLALGRTTNAPALPTHTVAQAATAGGLGNDQATAVTAVATSGRIVDVLIGPAGAGKTTAMRALREAWTSLYGQQSVIGLAPSAAAAQVLGEDLGVPADTLARWLHEHGACRASLSAGQLVILDEASLAGTRSLHTIADHAATVGAKVLLVGDWAQLAAVNAGGALQLLARDRDHVAQLTNVRRFTQPWEATATLQLRDGNPSVLNTYAQHGRLHDGDTGQMLDAAYTAWRHDQAAGRQSLLIAPTREQVAALNGRAQTDRIATGEVQAEGMVPLRDGTAAGVGDVVVTRRNDRRLHGPGGWVRNGDRWTITATQPDGTIHVRRHDEASSRPRRLPAKYVAEHVELGYATTTHRAQGATVDTAHAIVTAAMTREALYVAMTRGRHGNHAYVCTDTPDAEPHQNHKLTTPRHVLTAVLTPLDPAHPHQQPHARPGRPDHQLRRLRTPRRHPPPCRSPRARP